MLHYFDLLGRILDAGSDGYALAYVCAGALALLLPMPQAGAIYISAMLAFLPHAGTVL